MMPLIIIGLVHRIQSSGATIGDADAEERGTIGTTAKVVTKPRRSAFGRAGGADVRLDTPTNWDSHRSKASVPIICLTEKASDGLYQRMRLPRRNQESYFDT